MASRTGGKVHETPTSHSRRTTPKAFLTRGGVRETPASHSRRTNPETPCIRREVHELATPQNAMSQSAWTDNTMLQVICVNHHGDVIYAGMKLHLKVVPKDPKRPLYLDNYSLTWTTEQGLLGPEQN